MKREHLAHFSIAGFTYYDGVICFNDLKIGTLLNLVLEENNPFDARAVAIYYNSYKLGFIPRTENRIFYKLLKVGFSGFEARIQYLDCSEHAEGQIGVVVHLIQMADEK
ncbi:HIRAN domain-containing protein [Pedobacter flavus]|uniref:HIRAN domain-containing protein n=1 Tax=Pedobacter flavus TaxID=3113906 RepID=A0ABU7GZV0_9SPHI|nr:HIRAN domain-containing protein [Pedobacter sp. VNH31]MEE1884559.1 HIRAN domain-containing protein [Pedobacter sp. VNH31]